MLSLSSLSSLSSSPQPHSPWLLLPPSPPSPQSHCHLVHVMDGVVSFCLTRRCTVGMRGDKTPYHIIPYHSVSQSMRGVLFCLVSCRSAALGGCLVLFFCVVVCCLISSHLMSRSGVAGLVSTHATTPHSTTARHDSPPHAHYGVMWYSRCCAHSGVC